MKVSNRPATSLGKAMENQEKNIAKAGNSKASNVAKALTADPAQVNLSNRAKQIKQATDIAKQDTVDEKKVAYFQNLIDSGKYQMDSAKVADKLVDEHLKFPS